MTLEEHQLRVALAHLSAARAAADSAVTAIGRCPPSERVALLLERAEDFEEATDKFIGRVRAAMERR